MSHICTWCGKETASTLAVDGPHGKIYFCSKACLEEWEDNGEFGKPQIIFTQR